MEKQFTEADEYLRNCGNVYILTHQSPDGDTLGSAFALWNALTFMGRKAKVLCSDEIPQKFEFLTNGYKDEEFEPDGIIAVDIAEQGLLGEKLMKYKDSIDLCIDHHVSNRRYAKRTLVMPDASATCEVIFQLFNAMRIQFSKQMATCLYTGIATDTGCFKFSNTSVDTHIAAAVLIAYRIDYARINRMLFDVKSKDRIALEAYIGEHTDYYFDDRLAIVPVTTDIQEKFNMKPSDFEGLSAMSTRVETIEVGIVIKQKSPDLFKISMRSTDKVNVSEICSKFGGGGHFKAAGCTLTGSFEDVRARLISAVEKAL